MAQKFTVAKFKPYKSSFIRAKIFKKISAVSWNQKFQKFKKTSNKYLKISFFFVFFFGHVSTKIVFHFNHFSTTVDFT